MLAACRSDIPRQELIRFRYAFSKRAFSIILATPIVCLRRHFAMDLSAAKKSDIDGISSLTILVVDDDELNRRLMSILLKREGHHVDVASNGLEAFDAIKVKKYDIVFMDLQMPVMDGIEASRQIRAWENGGAHTFIVALTASYLPEKGQILFEAGMDNYISKPFEVEHIQRLLRYSSRALLNSSAGTNVSPVDEVSIKQVLDTQLGIQQVGGDSRNYRELLTYFLQELPEKIELVHNFFEAQKVEEISRAAHNLKGVAASLGATQLSNLAHRLDDQSSGGYTESLGETIQDLEIASNIFSGYASDFLNKKEN
jgi:CheY-like chemotaxis protein/HPt (histidine-containing phosphotransfer) domain-containing protein